MIGLAVLQELLPASARVPMHLECHLQPIVQSPRLPASIRNALIRPDSNGSKLLVIKNIENQGGDTTFTQLGHGVNRHEVQVQMSIFFLCHSEIRFWDQVFQQY